MLPYLVLLRVGFTLPQNVTTSAVRSYRTISPLPAANRASNLGGIFSVALAVGSRPQALPGTLSYGARTFLPSKTGATVWPTLNL